MVQKMIGFLGYFFSQPNIIGIGLALVFGAAWLALYRPPLFKNPWLWAVMAGSAILTPIAIDLTAFPVSIWIMQLYSNFWSEEVIMHWILLASIFPLFVTGLVQMGCKLVPVVIYWWYKDRNIDPKLGLAAGAVAGAGFGILEAQWAHNYILASGWSWTLVQSYGIEALGGFWGRFFVVGWHVATCALAGWGLAKGKGWQFYLLASLLFVLLNYTEYLVSMDLVEPVAGYIIVAAWALLVTGAALWLRERQE
jgi:hypothetical protein